jgi:hypothetical protein
LNQHAISLVFSRTNTNQLQTNMKKHTAKISVITLCAAVILAVPALSRAQDTSTNAPAAGAQTAPAKKHSERSGTLPFHGDLTSVDTNAMTFVVGTRTFEITSDTRITKDDKPAVLADGVAGQPVSGAYKKNDEGKLDAVTVHFGGKAGGKKKTEPAAGN